MLDILKKVFYNPDKETIDIFERNTKIEYEEEIFESLKVLSISNTKLKNLNPFRVFKNLEILNLSYNEIQDIEPLKDLRKLKILDLRFNKIKNLPSWIFATNKNIYWKRENDTQEGIFLEGNPLDRNLILKISENQNKKNIKTTTLQKNFQKPKIKIEKQKKSLPKPKVVEKLIPLNRQKITIFKAQNYNSNFIDTFQKPSNGKLKLNISIIKYIEKNYQIENFGKNLNLEYIILVLNEIKCCLHPPILDTIYEYYRDAKIFIIIENKNINEAQKKVDFFKNYNKLNKNIISIYHTTNQNHNQTIKEKIYNYIDTTIEPNSLWKKEWIFIVDEVEKNKISNKKEFQKITNKYKLSTELSNYIFEYLIKVGSIKY